MGDWLIAEGKDVPRLASWKDYQVSHQESVVTGEIFDYISSCQTRSLPYRFAWFTPDRGLDNTVLLDTFCQEDVTRTSKQWLDCSSFEETRCTRASGGRVKRPWWFWMGPQSPCNLKGFIGNLVECFSVTIIRKSSYPYQNQGFGWYVGLAGAMPDTELLTILIDSRATDESALKEAAKSRNFSYQGWQDFSW